MSELDQRFQQAARDYPGFRHFAVLHDYREFDAAEAVRVAPIMGMYHNLLVRPICDGRMVGTCHLSGRTSLLSRFVLTALHGMEDVGAVMASTSVLCDARDANSTSDEQQGRPGAFELLDELARSWVRVVAPEIVDAGGSRYDWPGHVLHLLHLAATMLEDGYLHSGCHKLVWDRNSVGVKRKDDRTVQMYEVAPGYVGMVPDGAAVAADGAMLDWEFVLSVLSCLHVRVRVLEPSVFDALGYWTKLLLESEDSRIDFLLRKTLVAADDTGTVGVPGAGTEEEGAEKLSVGGWQWVESMLCEVWRRRPQDQDEPVSEDESKRPEEEDEADGATGYLGLEVDLIERTVSKNGETVVLVKKERPWKLFKALFEVGENGESRQSLQDKIWERDVNYNNLDQQKKSLIKLLEPLRVEVDSDQRGIWRLDHL